MPIGTHVLSDEGSDATTDFGALAKIDDGALTKIDGGALTEIDDGALTKIDDSALTTIDDSAVIATDGGFFIVADCGALIVTESGVFAIFDTGGALATSRVTNEVPVRLLSCSIIIDMCEKRRRRQTTKVNHPGIHRKKNLMWLNSEFVFQFQMTGSNKKSLLLPSIKKEIHYATCFER